MRYADHDDELIVLYVRGQEDHEPHASFRERLESVYDFMRKLRGKYPKEFIHILTEEIK